MDRHILFICNKLDTINGQFIHKSMLYNIVKEFLPSNKSLKNTIRNLKNNNKIKYLFQDYFYILSSDEQIKKYYRYSPKEMVFVILNKLKIKWYLGLYSALQIHNLRSQEDLFHQVPKTTLIINSKFSRKINILNEPIIFKKQKQISCGINKSTTNNRITFYYSDLERTHIDYIFYFKKSNLNPKKLDLTKLKKHLKSFPVKIYNMVINE